MGGDDRPFTQWVRIGEGASAEVWALDQDRVVKLFHPDVNDVPVALEYEASRWADTQGLPVARPLGQMAAQDRKGILFQRVDGPAMLTLIRRSPGRMWPLISRLAQLHAQMHGATGGDMLPKQVDVLRHRIMRSQAGEPARQAALNLLDRMPPSQQLVHGDFHPGNILLPDDGPVIIDWAQAANGHPAADVARTELLLRFGAGNGRSSSRLAGAIAARWYRHCYAGHSGLSHIAVDAWRLPVAVAWDRGQLGAAEKPLRDWIARLLDRI